MNAEDLRLGQVVFHGKNRGVFVGHGDGEAGVTFIADDGVEYIPYAEISAPERIVCSAIWVDDGIERMHLPTNVRTGLVFSGLRHSHCLAQVTHYFRGRGTKLPKVSHRGKNQGFLTSENRFVDRKEAALIALNAAQAVRPLLMVDELDSSDLFP